MTGNIITSAKADISTKDFLFRTPLPTQTDSYQPVPHRTVIESIYEALDKSGIKIDGEAYKSSRGGNQAEGYMKLSGMGDSEISMRLNFLNSYDKSIPLAYAIGGHVIVCRNGMVVGDIGAFKRRHTGTVLEEFTESIIRHVNSADEILKKINEDKERMKNIEITKRTCAELMGRMFLEERIINSEQLNIVKKEIDASTFDYGVTGTAWNAYNNVTVALKDAHPSTSLQKHRDLHNFFAKEYAL